MSTPESLLKMESLEAVKQILMDNLPAWVEKEWLVIENIRPQAAPLAKGTLAEMTFSSFYAPPAVSAKFRNALTFQYDRLNLSEFLTGVDKTVKFKGSISSVDILSRALAKYNIPVSERDVELFTTEAAGSYVITAPASSPRWVGSVALQLLREAYLLKEFFKNTAIFIPFSPSFRTDDFLKVLLAAIENHNSSYEEPYTLLPQDFRISSGPTAITPDDEGLNTKITLTGVGGQWAGDMDFVYQRKSYTSTYRHPVVVETGGTVTPAKILDAINFKFDTGLIESDVSNWASLPASITEKGTYRLMTVENSMTTVGDIYVELVIFDEANQIDLATEIFDDTLDGFVLTHQCKIPLDALAPNKFLDGFIPPNEQPDVSVCIHTPYLDGFTSDKKVPIGERIKITTLDGWDSDKRKPIGEFIPADSLEGFESDKKKTMGDTLPIKSLYGWDSDKGIPIGTVLEKTSLDGFTSAKTKPIGEKLTQTELIGFDSNKRRLIGEILTTASLDGFESDKRHSILDVIILDQLDGWDSDKTKLLSELVGPRLDGFESDKVKLLAGILTETSLEGFESDKLTKSVAEALEPQQDGFDSDKRAKTDLIDVILVTQPDGLNYPIR